MKIRTLASIAVIAGVAAWGSLPAAAQGPAGAVMLVPGVWTTPEISAKCQAYAAKRAGVSGINDTTRQSVALACAQKLWKKEIAKGKSG
jgi:hypothetical protein